MKHFPYHRLMAIVPAIILSGCAGTNKEAATDNQPQWSPPISIEESRISTGSQVCARYNEAVTTDTHVWEISQSMQEYTIGYVIGLFEGQGRNLPSTDANISKIHQLFDTTCIRSPRFTIQQAADSVGQILLQQLANVRFRKPAPSPGTTSAMECGYYIDNRNNSESAAVIARHAAHNWADGYVTALLESAHRIFEPNANKARVLQALETTCTDNPRLTIQDAAETVAKPLIASASRKRPGSGLYNTPHDEDMLPRGNTVVE